MSQGQLLPAAIFSALHYSGGYANAYPSLLMFPAFGRHSCLRFHIPLGLNLKPQTAKRLKPQTERFRTKSFTFSLFFYLPLSKE